MIIKGYNDLFGPTSGILTIFHAGIKDYSLLFPHIERESLRTRLGQFAQEAESALKNQAWMSYILMVGAVLEGLLFNKFGNKTFSELIEKSTKEKLIGNDEGKLFDEIRATRNRIHASRHMEPYSDRKTAIELSVVYERLLKRNWNSEN